MRIVLFLLKSNMRFIHKQLLALTLVMSCLAQSEASETYSVMLYEPNNPPYVVWEDKKASGIFIDIFEGLSRHTEAEFKFIFMPIARALHEFDAGNIDIEPGVNPDWRRHLKVLGEYSIPYAVSEEVVVFSAGNHKEVNGPSDLFDDIVGIVRGFSYPDYDAAFSTDLIIRVNNVSQTNLLQQLLKNRFKQVFVGLNTILYFQKIKPEYSQLEIGNVVDVRNVMMRLHPNKKAFMPKLNSALQIMIDKGAIEHIYARYR